MKNDPSVDDVSLPRKRSVDLVNFFLQREADDV